MSESKPNAVERLQVRTAWIVDCDGFEFMLVTMDEFAGRIGMTPTQPSKRTDKIPDREPDFKD